ncbi:MAG: BACON domain-containing protein [Prevotella sp.]|nr:BACON domain-containing protein [Prevotella sp.]
MGKMKYIVIALIVVLTACSESGDVDDIVISKERIGGSTSSVLSVDVSSINFESSGGEKVFRITSNTGWKITHPDWCTLSVTTGADNASVTVTVDENTATSQRNGAIVVTGVGASPVTIPISQDARAEVQTVPGSSDNPPPTV